MSSTVNYSSVSRGRNLVNYTLAGLGLPVARGQEDAVARVADTVISAEDAELLSTRTKAIGVSDRFNDVIATFNTPAGETPAGFRIESNLSADGLLVVDLVRDIGYDRNGVKRPTGVIFSADTANPYELEPIAPLLGNLTCNPGIVYDLFLNNPKANVDGKFKNLEEVMTRIGELLGPGCDVSVEIENPFDPDFDAIVESLQPYREILSDYRLVVKVPHTGPVNNDNVGQLLSGDKTLDAWHAAPATRDAFAGHNLALRLREEGYRINYTLMFEPHQTALALQAKPYFINSFVRHRLVQSGQMSALVDQFHASDDMRYLDDLKALLVKTDHLSANASVQSPTEVLEYAENLLRYRHFHDAEGADGLDGLRHNLRMLKQSNLPDTRLIVCSMEGPQQYPDIDKVLVDPEFADVIDRLVITAEPGYLARFTSASHVVSYQRRFMSAAATAPARQ
ncbi:transaldolase family protein [Aestuariimicrobium sp. Y1814]|uniref:transaldolase family protein n=1 Tax=Aestuariimicrobium sp. Y1814 TaxID=3418742 RepID=UPI003DA7A04C